MTEHMICKKCGSPVRRGFTDNHVSSGLYVLACSRKTCDNYVKMEIISQFDKSYENYEIDELDNDVESVVLMRKVGCVWVG